MSKVFELSDIATFYVKEFLQAKQLFNTRMYNLQVNCKHDVLAECSAAFTFSYTQDARICLLCGLQEHEERYGFIYLKHPKVYKISKEEFMNLRVGPYFSSDTRGNLINKSTTLKDLLKEYWKPIREDNENDF